MKPNSGVAKDLGRPQWVTEVTSDAVKHFAWGIGDNNPLWIDQEDGAASEVLTSIAPPSFAYAVDETTVAPGLEGYERHYESVKWEWYHRLELGDRITSESIALGEDHDSARDVIWQHGETVFHCRGKGIIAKAKVTIRRDKKELTPVDERNEIKYSPEELSEIEEAVLQEKCRGSSPRYWEGVSVGDPLGTITKGPLSIMDIVAWCAGTMGSPDNRDSFSTGGLDDQAATGPQLAAWTTNLLTNWMGDEGFLHELTVTFSGLPFLGSTTTISGSVASASINEGKYLCEVAITCLLQNGDEIANGSALIELPSSGR